LLRSQIAMLNRKRKSDDLAEELAPLSEFAKGVMVNTWMSGATEKARDGPSGGSASGSGMDAAVQTNVVCAHLCPAIIGTNDSLEHEACPAQPAHGPCSAGEEAPRSGGGMGRGALGRGHMEGTWAQCGEEYVGLVENAKVVAMLATMEEKIGSMEEGMREEESESFLFYEQEMGRLRSEIQELQGHNTELEETMEKLRQEEKTLKGVVQNLQSQLRQFQSVFDSLPQVQVPQDLKGEMDAKQMASQLAMLATMEEKIGSVEEGMREEESESFLFYEQEMGRLRSEIQELQGHNTELEEACAGAREKENTLKEEITSLRSCSPRHIMAESEERQEIEDLNCQIRVLVCEKDGFKVMAEAEKARRKEAYKKVEVGRIKKLMEESQKREHTYNQLQKNKLGSAETAQYKKAAMEEFILRQQWATKMTESITNRLHVLQNADSLADASMLDGTQDAASVPGNHSKNHSKTWKHFFLSAREMCRPREQTEQKNWQTNKELGASEQTKEGNQIVT